MGVKHFVSKVGEKAGDKVAKLAKLSPEQLQDVENKREKYLTEMPDPTDATATALTEKLLAANSVEIYNAFLQQLSELYVPVDASAEYDGNPFDAAHNIRYFKITKWVTDKKENSLEKLINVYEVLSNEECNIALVFHRGVNGTDVYLAVVNIKNTRDNNDANTYERRIADAIRGNFPGSEWSEEGKGILPCLNDRLHYSVATATNIPTEKSEKFMSQTIEKLLDGIVPENRKKEYTLILLATPIQDVESGKLLLEQIYSGLAPYAGWQTSFTYNESSAVGSSATVGVNVGASAGVQNGQNQSVTNSNGTTDSTSDSVTDSTNQTESVAEGITNSNTNTHSDSLSHSATKGRTKSKGKHLDAHINVNASLPGIGKFVPSVGLGGGGGVSTGTSKSTAQTVGEAVSEAVSNTTGKTQTISQANSVGRAVAKTLGKAVTKTAAVTEGVFKSTNLGVNFGANFARSSNVTATVGKNEGIIQNFTNYNVKHTLELLEEQMKRFEESSALGMWDFAAYVLSEDPDVANNVAHSYIALTEGEKSYMSRSAVNLWRGDIEDNGDAEEICAYLRELRHPVFGLNPQVTEQDESFNVYPAIVTATTALTGKELAYSLNFPKKSVAGLPVIECAEFGRNVITYDLVKLEKKIDLGKIFHMNHCETTPVDLSLESLKSHTFITGSTGSGKSNTIYHILESVKDAGVHFLVIEPAKGEYKNIFGNDADVHVYGTNPLISPLLRINPFSFPNNVHVLEHLDRLVEIFNVCWPMYAAMPAVLKSAIEKSYKDCGWDLITSKNKFDQSLFPSFDDVARNIKTIIESSEYDSENKGAYKGSLLTRLQSLTTGINALIFQSDELSDSALFDKNVIIDLSRVGSSETKSLIMGMLVLKLQEYRMSSGISTNADLQHLTVLEEAHNLLRRTSIEQPTESSNIQGKSVELIANAIAEMRTYGEGFVIADQAPGLMDMSVIRNTNTKIIMRLPDKGDRELVGKSANLNNDQIEELAKLPCGVGAVYQNEWIQPVLCEIKRYSGNEYNYHFDPEGNYSLLTSNNDLSDSLLHCIMDKELFQKGDKEDLRELKSIIIRSGLDSLVKVDFLNYLVVEKGKGLESLRTLLYDFLKAKDAIKKSEQYSDIHDWVDSVVSKLDPSVKEYSKKQIDLAMALILHEQVIRDSSYKNVYYSFTEEYRNGGGVF